MTGWFSRAVNLRARKTTAVGVNEDIPIESRSGAIEINPIGVDRLHIPSLTSGHHKIVSKIALKSGKSSNVADKVACACSVVVLIIENDLRSFRRWRNRDHMRGRSATRFKEPAKCAAGWSRADIIAEAAFCLAAALPRARPAMAPGALRRERLSRRGGYLSPSLAARLVACALFELACFAAPARMESRRQRQAKADKKRL